MKCLVSLNSLELVSEFIQPEDIWKDYLTSVLGWDGQEIPYERVAKIRIEGVPIVLREDETFRKIVCEYGPVIEPFEFSWEGLDVSTGTCLVLHGSGKRIEEEICLLWKNKTYNVWVREVEHQWPPELKWIQTPVSSGEFRLQEPGRMDLEEGEFRADGDSDSTDRTVVSDPVSDPENQKEGEVAGPDKRHSMHGETKSTHGGVVIWPAGNVSRTSCVSSRKRPRIIRSPSPMDYSNDQAWKAEGGKKAYIPSFPDLNDPSYMYSDPSGKNLHCGQSHPDGFLGQSLARLSQRLRWWEIRKTLKRKWRTQWK
ncbi:hypothetical protein L1987_31910 [Smallanthus sonchifolius]|uniref:Uncharacterized protein n=1 Tax=Smallanthus sonchifolius TaxID=185202 RepID=A0ACB9I840_9ASTR|nr:hypothetical protein L1987_31910 [Smallanthus sonchifolius]